MHFDFVLVSRVHQFRGQAAQAGAGLLDALGYDIDMFDLGGYQVHTKIGGIDNVAEDDDDAQKVQPARNEPAKGRKDRSLEIEQAAKHEIDKAGGDDEVAKVLSLVKLRISERVAGPEVLTRVTAYAAKKKQEAACPA